MLAGAPRPLSVTSIDSSPSCRPIATRHRSVPAWRTTLVTASWMMRNAARSMSAGSGSRLPGQSTSTRTPASRVVAASRSRPTRPGAGFGGAWSGPDSGSACRSPVTIRRSPDSVSRLVASMAARASRASPGLASKTRRPAPAWIAMTPMLCATMSCMSRAIRSRSASAACALACTRTSSALACACRIECPISQAMIVNRGAATVTRGMAGVPTPPPRSEVSEGTVRIGISRPATTMAAPVIETLRVRVAAM